MTDVVSRSRGQDEAKRFKRLATRCFLKFFLRHWAVLLYPQCTEAQARSASKGKRALACASGLPKRKQGPSCPCPCLRFGKPYRSASPKREQGRPCALALACASGSRF